VHDVWTSWRVAVHGDGTPLGTARATVAGTVADVRATGRRTVGEHFLAAVGQCPAPAGRDREDGSAPGTRVTAVAFALTDEDRPDGGLMPAPTTVTGERADLLDTLGKHRYFLRLTCQGITDEQARRRTTVSELTLISLIKHVADTEEAWVDFIVGGALAGSADWSDQEAEDAGDADEPWTDTRFVIGPADTLAGLLERYTQVARRTDELVATLPDLDASHPLPAAPWFEPGARWSARRVLLHIVAETAQHAGHADIIRESLDGAKSMG
jgi:hypothetical protein